MAKAKTKTNKTLTKSALLQTIVDSVLSGDAEPEASAPGSV